MMEADDLAAALKAAEAQLAAETKAVDAERKTRQRRAHRDAGDARADRRRARRARRRRSTRGARHLRAGRASATASRWPKRTTASAPSATSACGRRCSTPCCATIRSCSAITATGSSTTCRCRPRRRPRRRRRALDRPRRDVLPFDDSRAAGRSRRLHRRRRARQSRPGRLRRPRRGADGTLIEEFAESIGTATNNVAEYRGLLAALEWARRHGRDQLHVRSDSLLLVQQMLGNYKVKNAGLQPLHAQGAAARARDRPRHLRARRPRAERARRSPRQPAMDDAAG